MATVLIFGGVGGWIGQERAHASPAQTTVDLNGAFNEDAFSFDANRADGNFDGSGYTYAADNRKAAFVYEWTNYRLGSFAAGKNNSVKATGQTLTIPAGKYASIRILGASTNGDKTGTFRIRYSDSTYADVSVTMKDWSTASPSGHVVQKTPHRHNGSGDANLTN
ncbi:hypothetical protein [Cohnella hashimotonis]|uniref:Uncharacterized protein n=1 Tax=Cohnella hashimotonis TaxID=2826895 RepID=A0ABT6TAF9_9BACL|nr:hypothetical protein [Cohnella hashimotonis]MDI4643817.1 hypothetical protein [Cohnella hashimotonis]